MHDLVDSKPGENIHAFVEGRRGTVGRPEDDVRVYVDVAGL